MFRRHIALISTCATLGALPALGAIEESRSSGQLCQGASATDRAQISYTSSGALNNDTTASRVIYCGNRWIGAIANTNSIYGSVAYLDRSTVDSLSCRLEIVNNVGTVYTGPWVYSCATSGGCATPTASYTNTTPGALNLALTHPVVGLYSFAVRCNIGRRSTTLGSSGVLSYTMGHNAVGF